MLNSINFLEKDNLRLRNILSINRSSNEDLIAAAVIARTTKSWWQQLELNKGELDGIAPGDAVMGPGGLIGLVNSVTPTTSRVRLLTASGSRVGVWLSRTKHHGILVGVGTNRPKILFLEKDPKVQKGDFWWKNNVMIVIIKELKYKEKNKENNINNN